MNAPQSTRRLPPFVLALLVAALLAGCARRPGPPPHATPRFLPDTGVTDAERQTSVIFRGPVQHPVVPWFDGLTLAQALVAAHYALPRDPKLILLLRDGVPQEISPAELLAGHDEPLAPGDVVEIIP